MNRVVIWCAGSAFLCVDGHALARKQNRTCNDASLLKRKSISLLVINLLHKVIHEVDLEQVPSSKDVVRKREVVCVCVCFR